MKIGIKKKLESILKRFAPKKFLAALLQQWKPKKIKLVGKITDIESYPKPEGYKEAKAE